MRTLWNNVGFAAMLIGVAVVSSAAQGEAEIGAAAPPLSVVAWVKGAPFKEFQPGKLYAIEFWGTWSPHSTEIIHLMTEQSQTYGDKLVFVGVSEEKAEVLRHFVAKLGEQISYTVVGDDEGKTAANYLKPFEIEFGGADDTPHAFLVDGRGTLVWHGHPVDTFLAVDEILAGRFDPAAVKAKLAAADAQRKVTQHLMAAGRAYIATVSADEVDREKASKMGDALVTTLAGTPNLSSWAAHLILTEPGVKFRDAKLAMRLATPTAGSRTSDLKIYVLTLEANGKLVEAAEVQRKVVALSTRAYDQPQQTRKLAELEKAAKDRID